MIQKTLALLCVCAWLAAGGCAAGQAETPQSARAAQDQQIYDLYRQYMETTNQQREQAGLPPLTVRSYNEFRRSPGTD